MIECNFSFDICRECGALSQTSTGDDWTCDHCEHQILMEDYNTLDSKCQELEEENAEQAKEIERLKTNISKE